MKPIVRLHGAEIDSHQEEIVCPFCGGKAHVLQSFGSPFAEVLELVLEVTMMHCEDCNASVVDAQNHLVQVDSLPKKKTFARNAKGKNIVN